MTVLLITHTLMGLSYVRTLLLSNPRRIYCARYLDNETELTILEHATDTAGYTDIVFALFDLLGMQFAPRLRDIGDQQLYRFSREQKVRHLAPRMKGTIRHELIVRHWDDLLRLAGSLKRGWVTASLFISKLQAYPRQNILTRALQEYGRLIKTLFILRYLENPAYRRRINAQLNKGESLHALRDFLFAADKGVSAGNRRKPKPTRRCVSTS
jgi:TnpA family transposase